MRKSIINPNYSPSTSTDEQWLDLEKIAQVEITSENPEYPIEKALLPNNELGWCAAQDGEQVIRLIFDQPQSIGQIALHFIEKQVERTQEFVLRWSENKDTPFYEIVRQQWNFNSASTEELENYQVNLLNVKVLELVILPDIQGKKICASLHKLRLA